MATASLAMDTYYGVKQAIYGPIKTLLKKKDRSIGALFKKFCKRDFCDEVRDFKIPEPEAVAS